MKKLLSVMMGLLILADTSTMAIESKRNAFNSYVVMDLAMTLTFTLCLGWHDYAGRGKRPSDPIVTQFVHKAGSKMGIKVPAMFPVKERDGTDNFCVGREQGSDCICIPKEEGALIRKFSEDPHNEKLKLHMDETEAVMQHEWTHVKNNDLVTQDAVMFSAPIAMSLVSISMAKWALGSKIYSPERAIAGGIATGMAKGFASLFITRAYSRRCEYRADAGVQNPRAMIGWLERVCNPLHDPNWFFETHPSPHHRIARLEARAQKMEAAARLVQEATKKVTV